MREDGSVVDHTELVPAMGRRSVYVNALFTTSGFATQVTADQPIVVERAMYFDNGQGGHDTLATVGAGQDVVPRRGRQPRRLRYVAADREPRHGAGDGQGLVHDRHRRRGHPAAVRAAALAHQSVHRPAGARTRRTGCASIPTSRSSPNAPCTSTAAARATTPTAVAAPATEWFLPEGDTSGSFEEQLAVLNPQNQPVNVQVEFRPQDGDPPPPQRFSVGADLAHDAWTSIRACRTPTSPCTSSPTGRSWSSGSPTSPAPTGLGRDQLDRADALDDPPSAAARRAALGDRPYLALNMVATVDGRAALNGSAVGIGSAADKRLMRELRAEADVVLHGAGTVRADPLSARVPHEMVAQRLARGLSPQPLGAIVTRSGNLPRRPPVLRVRHGHLHNV